MSDAAVTPYIVLGDARRRAVEAAALEGLARWRRKWSGQDAPASAVISARIETDCSRLQASQLSHWQVLRATVADRPALDVLFTGEGAMAAVGVKTGRVGALNLSPPAPGSLGHSLQVEMLSSLGAELLAAARIESFGTDRAFSNAEQALREAVRGRHVAVTVEIGRPAAAFIFLLAPEFVESLAPVRRKANGAAAIEPLRGVEEEVVHIEACLGETQLSFGELASLAPGNVVVLDQGLNQPVRLRIRGGECFAEGELGSEANKLAVRISNEQTHVRREA